MATTTKIGPKNHGGSNQNLWHFHREKYGKMNENDDRSRDWGVPYSQTKLEGAAHGCATEVGDTFREDLVIEHGIILNKST
jgi:hypothetical protein